MPTEKMVDADFLGRLMMGSLEAQVGAVEEAVSANASLFGGDDGTVRAVATYPNHAIVANSDGEFYRVGWSMTEDGDVELGDVDEVDVPVIEADAMTGQVRAKSREIVEALLSGDGDVDDRVRDLVTYAMSGARLTAEGVEDHWSKQTIAESDWFKMVRDQETTIRAYLGAEVNRLGVPKPKFEAMIESDLTESQEEGHRKAVLNNLVRLSEWIRGLGDRLALATQIDESYEVRDGEGMEATDFVDFVGSFVEDYEEVAGIVSDAASLAEDGCVKCLARLHDGVAAQMTEWALAAAFMEKLARRFEAPQAA